MSETYVDNWRNQILSEFIPNVARITHVADPDGLLQEDGILAEIYRRGFELIPFNDPIAFRYAFESKFRSRWQKNEQPDIVVVLDPDTRDLNRLPYDLLQGARKLSFSLDRIFPKLSYRVVAVLDNSTMDALYDAQKRHAPVALGDSATKEFILRHVFEITPELVKEPVDLLRVLLRRHHRGQRIPSLLDDHLVQLLRRRRAFRVFQ